MNQATKTHVFTSAFTNDPAMALVFMERNQWMQLVSMKGQTVQITHLDHEAAAKLGDLLLSWAKPIWWTRVQKWENTARQATARVRELEREAADFNSQLDIAAAEIRELRNKLAQALDRSAIIANELIQLRKTAGAYGLHVPTKVAPPEPAPWGLDAPPCPVQPKPLAYVLKPSCGNDFWPAHCLHTHKVLAHGVDHEDAAKAAENKGYSVVDVWDARHPSNPGPVPAYPAPEQGSSETAPARPFMAPMRQSAQQRTGNVLHIKEVGKWGRYSWCLFWEDGSPLKPRDCDGKFPSIEQAIQWCKRHDFDYRY